MASRLELLKEQARYNMDRLFDTEPFVRKFHEGTATHRDYYARHVLEAVIRIRLNNEVDAHCLARNTRPTNRAAAFLSKYLAEEYGHDTMIEPDLTALGLTRQEIETTPPFFSTELLMAYLRFASDESGPLPNLVWDWFVEWYSERYNGTITARAREEFGAEAVRGLAEHVELDGALDHEIEMASVLEDLLQDDSSLERALLYLDRFGSLVEFYFRELHEATMPQRKEVAMVR